MSIENRPNIARLKRLQPKTIGFIAKLGEKYEATEHSFTGSLENDLIVAQKRAQIANLVDKLALRYEARETFIYDTEALDSAREYSVTLGKLKELAAQGHYPQDKLEPHEQAPLFDEKLSHGLQLLSAQAEEEHNTALPYVSNHKQTQFRYHGNLLPKHDLGITFTICFPGEEPALFRGGLAKDTIEIVGAYQARNEPLSLNQFANRLYDPKKRSDRTNQDKDLVLNAKQHIRNFNHRLKAYRWNIAIHDEPIVQPDGTRIVEKLVRLERIAI